MKTESGARKQQNTKSQKHKNHKLMKQTHNIGSFASSLLITNGGMGRWAVLAFERADMRKCNQYEARQRRKAGE